MLFRLTMTAMQFNATVGYSHYCCISIVVAVKPWALTSGNSTSRRHMYCISSDAMSPTNCKEQGVVTEWAQSRAEFLQAGIWTSPHHLNNCPWPPSVQPSVCACGQRPWISFTSASLLYHRKSRPQQQSADATVQKDSLAPLLTLLTGNVWCSHMPSLDSFVSARIPITWGAV